MTRIHPYSRVVGIAKNQMIQEYERGWSLTDGSVCAGCVEDDALETILREQADRDLICDFCGNSPAAPLDLLLEWFYKGLCNEYEDALEGVSWDGREGGYQWEPKWDTWDLVSEFYDVLPNDELLEAVCAALPDITWVESNFITPRYDKALNDSWARFCEAVKFKTRFVFWQHNLDEDLGAGEVSSTEILDRVGRLIDKYDLVRVLPQGHRLWRAQTHRDTTIDHTGARIGTAPRECALRPNRMSPAGIPMFYGADTKDTVIKEAAYGSTDKTVTWGQFELSSNVAVVDFTRLRPVPSMFDPEWGSARRELKFLHDFVEQLSKRVPPDREQIEYVPTQIVTEYMLHVYGDGKSVDGLMYRSSLTGESCVVLDVPNERCIDTGVADSSSSAKLVLDPNTVRSCPVFTLYR